MIPRRVLDYIIPRKLRDSVRTIHRKALMGLLGLVLAIHGLLFVYNWHLAREGYFDFTIFYTAGKIVRQGLGHHLYDAALQYQMQRSFASGVAIRKGPLPYNHPAFEALLFVPLTFLNYATAYVVWNLINLGILAVLPFLLRPHIPLMQRASPLLWFLVLLAFFPILAALMQGQDVILLLSFYALAFVALKRSETLAGFWLGLGIFRFQLVIPFVLILAAWKRWKTVQSFFITVAVMAGISIAVTGLAEAYRYPGYVLHLETTLERAAIFPAVMPNLRGLLEGWPVVREFPNAMRGVVLACSLVLLLWVIATGRSLRGFRNQLDLQFSVATVATVLLCYHSYAYDLSILAIPVLLISHGIEAGKQPWKSRVSLWLPVGLLFCTPLYILLGFRSDHLNLFAIVELLWLWGIRTEMARAAGS